MDKCEHCKWLTGEICSVGIECVNPNKTFRSSKGYSNVSHMKNLSTIACTKFEKGENGARERWNKYQTEKRNKK